MAESSMRDGIREVKDSVRPSEINPKLEEAVQNQPLLPHLLSFRVVGIALAIAAVVALVLFLLMSPMLAGVGLIITFFGAWFALGAREYSKSSAARENQGESEDESDSDDS